MANIVHDSPPGQEKKEAQKDEVPPGTYRVHVLNRVGALRHDPAGMVFILTTSTCCLYF